ncbi:MAG: cellulase family glycosylhydrolase, partial [Acidimicrobiia bacterium]
MTHGYRTRPAWFVDPHGRPTLLRGVNLGGSTKVPFTPNGATHLGVDFEHPRDVSFVGRPAPLDELDRHLDRIAHWGFNVLRFLVTWEAIEHAGPGEHDEAYLDYVRECVRRAGERDLLVFIDPHQDTWSRWTGGDGAPYWTLELAGMRPDRFVAAEAVALNALDWPGNYMTAPVATMWTLFYGGDTYA